MKIRSLLSSGECETPVHMGGHDRTKAIELIKKAGAEGIRYLRRTNNQTRREFGYEVGVDRSTIRRWEKGEQNPSKTSLDNIVETFGRKIVGDDFFQNYLNAEKWHGVKIYPIL